MFRFFLFFSLILTLINYRFCGYLCSLKLLSLYFIRLLSHVKNEDLLMINLPLLQTPITSAPVLPVLLNKKNRRNLISFYSTKNERLLDHFNLFSCVRDLCKHGIKFFIEGTSIFSFRDRHAIGNSLEKSKTLILLVSTVTGRSYYTSPFLKQLTII